VREHSMIMWVVILGIFFLVTITPLYAQAEGEGEGQGSIVAPSGGHSSGAAPYGRQPDEKGEKVTVLPVYKPPLRGAPEGRLAGGSRSPEEDLPRLHFLAPDHVGLTTKEQPVLYWFISEVRKYPLELSIVEVGTHDPIAEVRLRPPKQPGIQVFRLAEYGSRLRTGVLYRCFVKMIADPAQPSRNLVSFGDIQRIEIPDTLVTILKTTPRTEHVFVYAREGLWYDALAAVSDAIGASPREKLFRKQRAALLLQAGLNEVAEYEVDNPAPGRRK
jgi:hypothetical protein